MYLGRDSRYSGWAMHRSRRAFSGRSLVIVHVGLVVLRWACRRDSWKARMASTSTPKVTSKLSFFILLAMCGTLRSVWGFDI